VSVHCALDIMLVDIAVKIKKQISTAYSKTDPKPYFFHLFQVLIHVGYMNSPIYNSIDSLNLSNVIKIAMNIK